MKAIWYHSPVLHGSKIGRTLGYPTLNLNAGVLPENTAPGVYAAQVKIDGDNPNAVLRGALFFGPRLIFNETTNVLEIYLLDFAKEVYNQNASFKLMEFIRPPLPFTSQSDLRAQIDQDILAVSAALTDRQR